MIDQRFKDYIQQQSAAGVARDDIRKALVINGLSEQDIAEGFASQGAPLVPSAALNVPPMTAPMAQASVPLKALSIWNKGIPRTNWTFMIISLLLVFGLDLFILFASGFSLMPFWIAMLVVFGIFAVFFCLENYVFSKKFSDTKSALDPWISGIIVVRNLVFLLNFIPFIQILGMMLLGGFLAIIPSALMGGSGGLGLGNVGGLGGTALIMPGLLIIYIILIAFRFSAAKHQ